MLHVSILVFELIHEYLCNTKSLIIFRGLMEAQNEMLQMLLHCTLIGAPCVGGSNPTVGRGCRSFG
jgi:hypothetical protein